MIKMPNRNAFSNSILWNNPLKPQTELFFLGILKFFFVFSFFQQDLEFSSPGLALIEFFLFCFVLFSFALFCEF